MANLVLMKIVRDDDKSITLGSGEWRIPSNGLKGIDFPMFSNFSEKNAVGDGALSSGKRVDDRDIQITARTTNPSNNKANRADVIHFFNPKHTFKIYATYQGVTMWASGELSGFSCPSENIYRPMVLTVKFYCANPFMKSVDDFGKNIAAITPGSGFPYIEVADPVIPAYADIYTFNNQVVITNDGDTVTYPRVRIDIKGNVTNPAIYRDEYFIKILGSFEAGDVIEIDFEECTIKKNGENWIHHIDRSSTFTEMSLAVGESTIRFEADDGDANMAVYVYYNKLYLGL